MDGRPGQREEEASALLERAYRMALILQSRLCAGELEATDIQAEAFEQFAIAKELVAVLDEARAALLVTARLEAPPHHDRCRS
jgi:hypothetical protein